MRIPSPQLAGRAPVFTPSACVFDEALSTLGVMLVLVASDGAMIWASAAAKKLLSGETSRAVRSAVNRGLLARDWTRRDHASIQTTLELRLAIGRYRVTITRLTGSAAGEAAFAALLERVPTLTLDVKELGDRFGMTQQQARVAKLLIDGHSNASIATKLDVKVSTARSHVEHVRRKLGVRTRAQVVARLVAESYASQTSP
jgi:DNA-binding CsgD family transcriptional regulator